MLRYVSVGRCEVSISIQSIGCVNPPLGRCYRNLVCHWSSSQGMSMFHHNVNSLRKNSFGRPCNFDKPNVWLDWVPSKGRCIHNEILIADNDLPPLLAPRNLDADLTNLGFKNHKTLDVAINSIRIPSSPKKVEFIRIF